MRISIGVGVLLCSLLWALAFGETGAVGYREPLNHESPKKVEEEWLLTTKDEPPPEGEIEGACGVAVSPLSGSILVSDYYHRAIHIFEAGGNYEKSKFLAGGDPVSDVNVLNAVCGLALDPAGNLYADELHRRVLQLPSEQAIDSGDPTGVAVDQSGNLYVDDRTYVAFYEAPIAPGEKPAEKVGLGTLGDAYGVAVDPEGKRIYVPDATDDLVKVYEPAVDLVEPVATIDGPDGAGFNSLSDAAVAVDPSAGEGHGHVLVVDDLEPGAEDPEAAVYEFGEGGEFLDRLESRGYGAIGESHTGPIFGEPSGMAVDEEGNLYVTTGNGERSNVLKYGAFKPFAPPSLTGAVPGSPAAADTVLSAAERASPAGPAAPSRRGGASASVVVQRRGVRVSFDGKLTPHTLPRHGEAPVGIAVDARIAATGGEAPPQLRRIAIAINRNGHFTSQGLPLCSLRAIQPSTTAGALEACGSSLVGEGHFSADVKLPEQSPFPSDGKVLAFNGRVHGKPAILAHIYGSQPAPTSAVLPFVLKGSRGTYGTILEASLPRATGNWGFVTGLQMSLRRHFSYRGRSRSFLSAGCPAPAGFPSAAFPLARTSFVFARGLTLVSILSRTCRARG